MHQAIRDWIVSRLNTVPGIGTVHSYQRYANREKELADLYHHNGRLHGWYIRRLSVDEKRLNSGTNIEQTRWFVCGYLAINDAAATELEFDDLLDGIRDAFRVVGNDPWCVIDVNGNTINLLTNQGNDEQIGFAVLDSQPVLFAGVLCHSAECQLITHRILKRA